MMQPPKIVIEPRLTDAIPDRARPARKPKHRKFWRIAASLLVAVLLWGAWAAAAFVDFRSGLQDADPLALERRIDWTSVRQGLRDDLQANLASPEDRTGAMPESAQPDRAIDALLSRQAVVNLLRTARIDDHGWDTARPMHPESARERIFGSSRIRYAFFSGSPLAFRVDISPIGDQFKRPLILLFRWRGDWQLTRVFLPFDADIHPVLRQQAPSGAVSSVEPAPQPLPPGSQRAVLFEEDPSNPQGKRYTGSVIWRTENISPAEDGVSELAVTAHVSIPEQPLNMTMTIRRNMDKSLPATHTIEVQFEHSSDDATSGIKDVAGIMMKPTDEVAGQRLAGSRVKVSDGFFLIGLSAIDLEVQSNITALKTQPWFGVPFVYNNGSRAVLAIEKGPSGTKAIADAFARWSKATETAGRKR